MNDILCEITDSNGNRCKLTVSILNDDMDVKFEHISGRDISFNNVFNTWDSHSIGTILLNALANLGEE